MAGADASLQQQIVNAVASSHDGTYSATEFLLSTTNSPAFESIVQWLLTGTPEFPPLTLSESRAFPLLVEGSLERAKQQTADPSLLFLQYTQQKEDFLAAAQFVGFNILLQGIQEKWEGAWSEEQKQTLKRSILSVIVGPDLAPLAELPAESILSGVRTPQIGDLDRGGKGSVLVLKTHASRMKCAQVLNAICQREWPQKWPGVLPCLVVKATRVPSDSLARQCTGVEKDGDTGETQARENQTDEAFAAACVLLGLVRELSQEAKEETRANMSLKRRIQIAQGLEGAVQYLLRPLGIFLSAFQQHRHVSHLRPLIVEFLRELAGVVEVSLILQFRDILLSLVKEGGEGGALEDCRLQILQTFDVLVGGLAKKRSKKLAVDAVPEDDLTSLIHCVIYLVASAMAQAANNKFEVDSEAFDLDVSLAEMVKHLCESCADQLLRRLDPLTMSLLWHGAILPLMAHPSLKIAMAGVAASIAVVKRFQFFSATFPSARSPSEKAFLQLQCEALARQLGPCSPLQTVYQQAVEQVREQTFPIWFDLKSYLSLLFLRTLRVGDPALLAPLLLADSPAETPASTSFAALLDQLVASLLQSTELPAALARAGCMLVRQDEAKKVLSGWAQQSAQGDGEGEKKKSDWQSPLLESIAALLPVGRYPHAVKGWYTSVADFSVAEDELGTDALQGFAARYAGMKSSSLLPMGVALSLTPYSARRVAEELTALAQLALGHPFFARRGALPDFLLLLQARKRPLLPDKQQPWVCPAYLVLDSALSFFEACTQRLKSASLTFAALQGSSLSSAGSTQISAVEWLLPAQAAEAPWEAQLASLFEAILDLKLVDLDAILSGRLASQQQAAFLKQTSPDLTGTQWPGGANAGGEKDAEGKDFCLYEYLLETRRLDFVASCAYFLNYTHVKVDAVLDLLFRRILAEAPPSTSAPAACSSGTYPLTGEQQIYLCRRRALYTLISLCTSCPAVLKNYLQMMLQHVQGRLQAQQAQVQDPEKNLLVESLVSLISASQIYTVQEEHTLPLVRPYVHELLLLCQKLGSGDFAPRADLGQGEAEARQREESRQNRVVGLLLFLLGERRTPCAEGEAQQRAEDGRRLTHKEEDVLTTQRRSLARVLSALESCIKRTTLPADPAAARAGGYLVDASSSVSLASCLSPQEEQKPFGKALEELLLAAASRMGTDEPAPLLPKRHPLAALVRELVPVLFQLLEAFQHLWRPELTQRWPMYQPHLTLGEEEFLSLHGHTPLSFTPSALLDAVALTFPAPSAADFNGAAGFEPSSTCSVLTAPADLTPAGKAYAKSSTRLIRRHLYHLRCLLYRLLGTCCSVPDGFYLLPKLDVYLEETCFAPIAFLPLQQLEQELRLFWTPLLDSLNLPPQPPYPSKQLVLLFLHRGVQMIVARLNREWEAISQTKLSLENRSTQRQGREEERDLNLYMLQVYAADALADSLLTVLKTVLHLTRPQQPVGGALSGGQMNDAGVSDPLSQAASAAGLPCPAGKRTRERGKGVEGALGEADEDHLGTEGDRGIRKKNDEEATAASAAHLAEMRKSMYSSGLLLTAVVAALLQAQRWPNPNTIMEAHNVMRTYVRSATKLFTPIPPCTAEICALILRGVMTSFFEKRQFDPLAFGDGSASVGMPAFPRTEASRGACESGQDLASCTPMHEFLSNSTQRPGKANSDANRNTQVNTYTATVYQVLKGMCRILGDKVSSVEGQKLQPSSLLLCPYTLGAFNFLRSTETPVRLSDDEFERFVTAMVQNDSKEGKAFVKEFFQKNWECMQRAERKLPTLQFKINDLPDQPSVSLAKLQTLGSCDLGSTFLSSIL
ncbi:conserved hypothetical protein [Neospora caninum Liverpool]|uniref:Exportin-5 C-terminal domain-containing protein n=1 Tax=Neospora caninum (strain Liverpool) TaxID=572307 RepID=F0VBN6_NEOCL|nr:conserved hypothetical protein [Neospora caninum Liverpool]CBZ51020.1 conserved hypothetical protein [Neospora caninum Liverpool]CEL68324.1 TPA: hypothetical protein BN1204_040950 [Neospora caninum Liverpool]|eukprot:XP_003881053.1 conserved hypothetical protein [Neospora caninum Liverpool]